MSVCVCVCVQIGKVCMIENSDIHDGKEFGENVSHNDL